MNKDDVEFVLNFLLNDCVDLGIVLKSVWKFKNYKECDPNELLIWSSKNGYINMCKLAKQFGATDYESMLDSGHHNICRLAKLWFDTDVEIMSQITEEEAHIYVCHFPYPDNWYYTKRKGHQYMCRHNRIWSRSRFNSMLCHGAFLGDENICEFAKDMGATNFDRMLYFATTKKHENLCRLAIEWGADCNDMLLIATDELNEKFCRLAIELGASNVNSMLEKAISYNNKYFCNLAIELGAKLKCLQPNDFDNLLRVFEGRQNETKILFISRENCDIFYDFWD